MKGTEAMTEVSKAEFYRILHADPRDIMPSIAQSERYDREKGGYTSVWKDRSGNLFGKSNDFGYWLARNQ